MTEAPFPLTRHSLPGGSLRPLGADDAPLLGAACAAIDPYRRLGMSATGLAAYLMRDDLHRYTVIHEDRLAGVLVVRAPWLRGPLIEMLAVLPAAQGLGLGRQIIAWAAAQARPATANLWCTVSDFNQSARHFYANCGFVEVCRLPELVTADAAEILLRLRLDHPVTPA